MAEDHALRKTVLLIGDEQLRFGALGIVAQLLEHVRLTVLLRVLWLETSDKK